MSRISDTFVELKRSGRGGFIPFITAGDPDLATTELLLIELGAAGADIIELGVPFSDPVADGEVIQRASQRALRNGVTLRDALTCIAHAKQHVDVPIVLFSYFNPLLQFVRSHPEARMTWCLAKHRHARRHSTRWDEISRRVRLTNHRARRLPRRSAGHFRPQ